MGTKAGLFYPTFLPTSEFFSSFLTFILYTLSFNPRTRNRSFFEANRSLNRANLSLNKANLSLNRAYLSLSRAILSLPKRYLLSPGGELLLSWEEVSSVKWQVSSGPGRGRLETMQPFQRGFRFRNRRNH